MNCGNDPFSDKPMHFKRIEQELFVGCLYGSISAKTSCLWWFNGSNNLFLIQGIMIRAGFGPVNPQILKFQDPARKIMEFLVGDEILGFVDELLFFLWWIQWIHEKCGIGIYRYLGRLWRFLRPRFTEIPRITELQKSEIRRAVRVEDLHRASDLGISAMSGNANHTNDEADMEVKHGEAPIPSDPGLRYGYPT